MSALRRIPRMGERRLALKRRVTWTCHLGALALVVLLGLGCAGPPFALVRDWSGPLPETTVEGLYRVRASQVGAVYLRPDAEFSRYDTVVIDPVTLAYRSRPRPATVFNRRPGNFILSWEATDRIRRTLRQAFEREMAGSAWFRVGSEAGEGVLRVSGHIRDLVWEVPPPRGGESYTVQRTGTMLLILDLRDSETGELLARVADRRSIQPEGFTVSGGYENSAVNHWAGVRYLASRWARVLRQGLDSLRALPRVPMPLGSS